MSHLIRNSIITPDGTVLISTNRHDYVSHLDKNGKTYAVDGGTDYCRVVGDMNDCTDNCVTTDDDFEIVREAFTWGTYGKNGDQPLTHKPLSKLSDAHITAILETQGHIASYVRQLFIYEQAFRDATMSKDELW